MQNLYMEYQILHEQLRYIPDSERNQLHLMERWLSPLLCRDDPGQLKTFVRELAPLVFHLIPKLTAVGCSPQYFQRISGLIHEIERLFPDLFDKTEYAAVYAVLSRLEFFVYSFLGAPDHFADEATRMEFRKELVRTLSERETLAQWIGFLESKNDAEQELAKDMLTKWDALTTTMYGCVHVPLIESDLTMGEIAGFNPFGTISSLHVLAQCLNHNGEKDVVVISHHLAQANDVDHNLTEILDAVRKTAGAFITPFKPCRYSVTLSYDDKRFSYSGSSHGLAVAAGVISVLSKESFDSKYYSIEGSAVLTGHVNGAGLLEPLTDDVVRNKVNAAYYSPYSTLVLPKENEGVANEALASLKSESPHRDLELVPVRSIDDVFDRRRVSRLTVLTLPQRTKKTMMRHRTPIMTVAALLPIIAFALYFLVIADYDDNPSQVKMEDNYFVVVNKNGKELWREMMGTKEYPITKAVLEQARENGLSGSYSYVCDLDGDKRNEVLLCHPCYTPEESDLLYCFGYNHKFRWKVKLGKPVQTMEGDYSNKPYSIHEIWAGKIDTLLPPRIITVTGTKYYSFFVNVLDPSGKITGEYFHPGKLTSFAMINSDKKGRKDILLAGTHNGFLSAVMFLLDAEHCYGTAPSVKRYRPFDPAMDSGSEKFYIRFPESDVAQIEKNIHQQMASFDSPGKNAVDVAVPQAIVPEKLGVPPNAQATLIFQLDYSLLPQIVNTTTYFDILYQSLKVQGMISPPLDNEYKTNLLSRIGFWDGEKFVNEWTMNKRYKDAVNRRCAPTLSSSK